MTVLSAWADTAAVLVDTAMGRRMADMVVKGGRWVNVHSGEIIAGTDIAIAAGRFAYVGPDASHAVGPGTVVVEAAGRYMVPGLCDGHMHVESGMVTVTEFARAVIPHGTTSMFVDPHEIANVLGLAGVDYMIRDGKRTPFKFNFGAPSCVPATERTCWPSAWRHGPSTATASTTAAEPQAASKPVAEGERSTPWPARSSPTGAKRPSRRCW